ncbi:MAG: VWA domain-containing protein, partial [Vicinamibacterales bacterium]
MSLKTSVFVMAAAVSVSAASAQVEPITRYAAEPRAVYASVLDKAGVPVTSLSATDFVVREGGIEREVLQVAPASEPMRIAILVDTSQAMRPHIMDVRRALHSFSRQMQGDDEISLFEFGDRPVQLVEYTRDRDRLQAGIDRLFARAGTGAYALDAIVDVARDFKLRETARPVIVVITSEGPEFSQRFHAQVLDDVRASRATLHSLVLTRRRVSMFNDGVREREITLSRGATMTGGRRDDLLTSMALSDRLTDLARELKTQYRVVYARPESLVPPDRIEIAVRQPRLLVRAPRVPFNF